MENRLHAETKEGEELYSGKLAAHKHFLAMHNAIDDFDTDLSGGGKPERVKCFHVRIASALAGGRDASDSAQRQSHYQPNIKMCVVRQSWMIGRRSN